MSILELFRLQAQTHVQVLTQGVLALEQNPSAPEQLDACMDAARSFLGAAHLVGLRAGVELACAMEHCFAAARRGELEFLPEQIDLMLQGVDLLDCIVKLPSVVFDGAGGQQGKRSLLPAAARPSLKSKCVLVVDDSFGARELGRKLLSFRGYEVQTAADGVDAWNALCTGQFDLVLTDTDMPLIDGFTLTQLIRSDPRFEALPVLMVCEEDREQDRRRSFEAGADYYVIRGRFHDTMAPAVASLIGTAQS